MTGKRRADGPSPSKGPTNRRGTGPKKSTKRPMVTGKNEVLGRNGKPVKARKLGKDGKPKPPLTPWLRVRKGLKWLLIVGLVGALAVSGFLFYLYKTTDLPDPNKDFEAQTTFVYYDGGKQEIGKFATQNRDSIPFDEMPQTMKDAVVAIENPTFWTDNGIDPKGILRAAFSNASGNATQGASTITQQYVKILYLNQERSYSRKLKEAILSLKLKREKSKEDILGGYLNTIYFGRGAYGIEAAAQAFFQVPAKKLTLGQSAVLASVINNPTIYDPANGRDARQRLKARYDKVLTNMADQGLVEAADAEKAERRLPRLPKQEAESTYGGQKGHVLAMVKKELLTLKDKDGNYFTEDEIDGGGLRITTTFTQKAMDAAAEGVAAARPEGFSDKKLHIGVASVEPGTGAVRGIFGGQDYLKSQINWAVAGGQAGSSLKPFALAAGLKAGFSLKDTFDGNSPYVLPNGDEIENQGDADKGSAVNLIYATEDSINTAFVDLTMSMGDDGPQQVVDMANSMGIPPAKARKKRSYGFPDRTPGLTPVPSVALGSATVSPINMANGYATIANGGVMAQPYIIEKVVSDVTGDTLYDHKVQDRQAIDTDQGKDIAADVSYALQQVVSASGGTGYRAQELGRPAAGKTGTSTNGDGDVVSAWFTGYTPQLATSVVYVRGKGVEPLDGWLPSFYGGDFPAETWTEVMKRDMEGVDEEDFPEPAYVDGEAPDTGHAPTLPPPPPQSPKPSKTPTTKPPSSAPTTEAPTQEPTTEAPTPPPSPTNTGSCGLITCPTEEPSSDPPSSGPSNPSEPPPSRAAAAATTETRPWWTALW